MKALEVEFSNNCYVKNITYDIELNDERSEVLNLSEDQRIELVTRVAAISRGNDSAKNPTSRYGKLLKEAAPNVTIDDITDSDKDINKAPGRPLEFAPIKIKYDVVTEVLDCETESVRVEHVLVLNNGFRATIDTEVFLNNLIPFSFLKDGWLYTNIRALINSGISYDLIPYNPVTGFHVVEVKAPYFAFAQIRTHGKLSQVAVSERVVKEDEYWLPEGALERIQETLKEKGINGFSCKSFVYCERMLKARTQKDLIDIMLSLPIIKIQNLLKDAGYHKEVYDRWPNHLKFKRWVMGGYMQDPKQWPHFLLEREAFEDRYKSWVQETTKDVALAIKQIIT